MIIPLNKLVALLDGPNKIIQKRFDKLLDYNNLIGRGKEDKVTFFFIFSKELRQNIKNCNLKRILCWVFCVCVCVRCVLSANFHLPVSIADAVNQRRESVSGLLRQPRNSNVDGTIQLAL